MCLMGLVFKYGTFMPLGQLYIEQTSLSSTMKVICLIHFILFVKIKMKSLKKNSRVDLRNEQPQPWSMF